MNKLVIACACLLGLGSAMSTAAPGAEAAAAFEQGNRLYEEGQFLNAIQAYRPLLTNAPTLALRFNLGNAYFKSGQIGEAIVEYLMAERLAPRDPDVRANLRFARDRVEGPGYQPGWIREKADSLTTDEWTAVVTGAIWIFLALLITGQLQPKWRRPLGSWTLLAGALATIMVAGGIWVTRSRAENRMAVVTQRDAVMRLGPFEESKSALDLKNGAELRVLDRKQNWIQVTPDNRQLGWLPAASVRIIDP